MSARPIYLDHAATTPVDGAVAEAMARCLTAQGAFGNAASASHAYGREAAAIVERARAEVATLIGAAEPREIVFTSGATESDNLALFGVARACADRGRHLVASAIEHRAVADPLRRLASEGFEVTWLEPDAQGVIAPETLRAALRADTLLVSVIHGSNELGTLQDLAALAAVARERGALFHSDAAQSAGKVPIDVAALGVDLLSLSAHKLYGPKGIGALYVAPRARPWLQAQLLGGGHERGLRSGTLATHQIAGFGAAAALARHRLDEDARRIGALRERLWAQLEAGLSGVQRNGHPVRSLPGLLSVSVEGVDGESLVASLHELALSTGSACSSALPEPSAVLRAIGLSEQLAESTLRLSLGRGTTVQEVDRASTMIIAAVRRLRAVSPRRKGDATNDALAEPPDAARTEGEIERRFRELPGAGRPPTGAPGWYAGHAGSPVQGAEVRVHIRVPARAEAVTEARFEAYGCPHTLAVASWVVERLVGRAPNDLVPAGGPLEWARVLEVPQSRLGRLLLIEDALRALEMQATGSIQAGFSDAIHTGKRADRP